MTAVVHTGVPRIHLPGGRMQTIATLVAVLAALHFGREILMPLALAVLVSFALGRPVAWMEKSGIGRTWSVGLVAGFVLLLVSASGWIAWTQLSSVLADLPEHRIALQHKLGALASRLAAMEAAGSALVPEPTTVTQGPEPTANAQVVQGTTPAVPLYVSAIDAGPKLLRQMPAALGWLLAPVGTAGVVVLFVVFMLLYREDLRNRCIRLIGHDDLTGTTLALAEASDRIGRYLGMQVLINCASGTLVAIGLFLLGVPGWGLWGFLYALLRFLPYVGPLLGVAMPAATALAVTPGWSLFLATLAGLLVLELVVNLVIEPWLYGESTGISSFAVLVTAAIWTWLWGPIGLLLAMPLTVAVVVLGKNVRQLAFLHVLFGTDEALSQTDRFYQRVIANDPDEAMTILEEAAVERQPTELYEAVLVPALAAAERDRASGKLDEAAYATLCEIVRDALDALELRYPMAGIAAAAAAGAAVATEPAGGGSPAPAPRCRVACLPVKGGATEVAAAVLCRLLERAGHPSRTVSLDLTLAERLADIAGDEIVCLVAVPDPSLRHLRATGKRLVDQRSDLAVAVLAWGAAVDRSSIRLGALADHTAAFVSNASDLVLAIARLQQERSVLPSRATAPAVESPQPAA
jgi:predicted PurR-regulated permease PerM